MEYHSLRPSRSTTTPNPAQELNDAKADFVLAERFLVAGLHKEWDAVKSREGRHEVAAGTRKTLHKWEEELKGELKHIKDDRLRRRAAQEERRTKQPFHTQFTETEPRLHGPPPTFASPPGSATAVTVSTNVGSNAMGEVNPGGRLSGGEAGQGSEGAGLRRRAIYGAWF
ncbi:hypothetical protein JCM6882_003945 [Rhodosporidiobolus microsporus]